MTFSLTRLFVAALLAVVCGAAVAQSSLAATVSFSADRDNTIWRTTFTPTSPGGQQLNDLNAGAREDTQVGTAGGSGTVNEVRTLISFDVSTIPTYTEINSVTMRLHFREASSAIPASFTILGNAISVANKDWVEGTGTTVGNDSGSTWNEKNDATAANWAGGTGTPATGGLTSAGTDYNVTNLFSETFTSLPADDAAVDFVFSGSSAQLTALIDAWQTDNGGILLRNDNAASLGSNQRMFFHTRDVANPLLHPELIVSFTAPPIPEPSTFGLLSIALFGLTSIRRRKVRA